jgi:hypothetical protein
VSRYRELSGPTHLEETEGDWVDSPTSPDPDPWAALFRQANRPPLDVSRGNDWDVKRLGGGVATSVAIAIRGLLVTTAAVATVAYLLLINSHI